MKTLTDLEAERIELVRAIADTNKIANERGTRAYRIQTVTTAHALGNATLLDLQQAQRQLDESVDALLRKQHLDASLVELDSQIEVTRGRERAAYCRSVADEHSELYEDYKAASRQLLEQFRQLNTLNSRYLGLVGRPLHGGHENDLHLPAVHGMLASRSGISSGQEIATNPHLSAPQ